MNEVEYFEKFASLLSDLKFSECATYFHTPCVLMNNKQKHVFNDHKDIATWLSRYAKRLAVENDNQLSFVTQHSVNMSSKVCFIKVAVQGVVMRDTKQSLNISFTLANDEDKSMKIIVVVIDDV
ncbi:hypothetical protein ISG33_03635 [Glaciecola sp. MH2013]|uniref:hypothetical protein n=1 Tax=Glaciecola sp. MH2013 TaxID=2785524 RepID=UPI00189F50DF|nr:hypothetical protein [Glaciecola sp. MH2013]MBF7072491.1 hypothetical protein [Glaciecola sp. MH2013]